MSSTFIPGFSSKCSHSSSSSHSGFGPIQFSLLLIAFFVHQAAGAEARMAAMEAAETRRRTQAGGEWQIPDADVQVGPPPYAPSRPDYPAVSRGVFDDLFRKWR